MAFDWKIFAASFLDEISDEMEDRREEADKFRESQREAALRNSQLVSQRNARAQQAAQLGERALQLGASQAQVRTAMASGMTGIKEFYDKLAAVASQQGVKRLGVDDIEAIVTMPNIPSVNENLKDMSLAEFAKQTYGTKAILPDEKTEEPTFLASLLGYGQKQKIRKELREEPFMQGMSVAEVNQIARQQEYNSLLPGATMTFTDIDYFTADEALDFSSKLTKAMADAVDGDGATSYIKAKMRAAGTDPTERAIAEEKARAFLKFKAARPLIEYFADKYQHGGFLDNKLVLMQIEEAVGPEFLADLMVMYGRDDEIPEPDEEKEPDKKEDKTDTTLQPTIKIEETLREEEPPKESESDEEDDQFAPAPPLSEEGKAIVEQALSGQLIKGYTAEYTRDQWDNMSRKQRKERGLPETRLGIVGFDFKDDIDRMLEKPIRNLTIKRNLQEDTNYKIKIRGRGTFTVTKEMLESMDDAAFRGIYPAIIIEEYKKGEKQKRKLPKNLLKRYQLGDK